MSKITWDMLIKEEPELKVLLKQTKSIKDDKTKPSFCANAIWYGYHGSGLRAEIYRLVGWEARKGHPEFMYTREAFDIAYNKVYNALPDCRNCICA